MYASARLAADVGVARGMVRCAKFELHGMALRGWLDSIWSWADEDGAVRVNPSQHVPGG